MPGEICEVRRAGHSRDFDHPRTRCPVDQQSNRQRDAKQHAIQQARAEHADQRRDRHGELRSAEAPDVAQCLDLDQTGHGHEDDGRQHRLWEIPEQAGEERKDDKRRECCK
jgi:hypothetical protein